MSSRFWITTAALVTSGAVFCLPAARIEPVAAASASPAMPFALRLLTPPVPPVALANVDLDGDGSVDLLIAGEQELDALFADRDGLVRGALVRTATPGGTVAMAVGDLDSDRLADAVLATDNPPQLRLLLSSPQGRLFDNGYIELPSAPGDIVAIHADGDTHLDLVVTLPDRGAIAWFRGEGDGTFANRGELAVGGRPTLLAVGQFDAHPGADILLYDAEASTISRLDGAAIDGAFPRRLVLAHLDTAHLDTAHLDSGATALLAEDLDGDGLTDLVVTQDGGTFTTFLSTATGKLVARPAVDLGEATVGPVLARVGTDWHLVVILPDSQRIAAVPWSITQRTFVADGVTSVAAPTAISRLAVRTSSSPDRPDSIIAIAPPTPTDSIASRDRSTPTQPVELAPSIQPTVQAPQPQAPTITLTGPVAPVAVKEGDDFFARVIGNPIDFDDRRDFGWEEKFSEPSISIAGGNWSATFAGEGSYVFPLFAGFPLALNTGRVGANFPIDTTKYRYVSYRSKVSSRSTKVVYWGRDVHFPPGPLKVESVDGYFTNSMQIKHPANAFVLDTWNLSANTDWTSTPVKVVRLDSSISAPAGTTVEFDWVRISDPTSSPTATITWTTVDIPQPNMSITPQVNIYIDNNNTGFDGDFLGRVAYNANTFSFPSSALPAGTYYFYLRVFDNTDGDTLITTSGYSSAYTVNGQTRVTITAPSMTSGADYATEVAGNPWDLDSSADIDNLNRPIDQQAWNNPSFSGGAFNATAIVVPPAVESDSQVWMKVDQAKPINTKRYRYLSYEMLLDPANFTTLADKVERGWISRIIWWNVGIAQDGSSSRGNVVYEGRRTYTLDLTPGTITAPDDPFPRQSGWRGNPTISNFRVDMTETPATAPTNFSLYDVKIRARPEPTTDNLYALQFTTVDPENDTATVQFFHDTDNTGFDGTLLTNVNNIAPGPHTALFSTAAFFPRDYWIYAVATDTFGNVTRNYADAPLHARPPVWHNFFAVDTRETPFVGDFNGDMKTDIIVFTRDNPVAFGDVYVSLSTGTGFGASSKWHDFFAINLAEKVVIGDYNGDGRDDIGTYLQTTSRQVYVATSTGVGMNDAAQWLATIGSDAGDLLYAGDANGDGKDDLILFARVEGKVYVALSTGSSFAAPTVWNGFFAVSTFERPRVGDVNGDNKVDILTFATDSPTAFGDVYVGISTGAQFVTDPAKWHDFFAIRPTEFIAVGDRDGDNKDDFFTFLPEPFGQVYTAQSLGTAMGANVLYIGEDMAADSTHLFFIGDVDGNGKDDIIEFDQTVGKVRVTLST